MKKISFILFFATLALCSLTWARGKYTGIPNGSGGTPMQIGNSDKATAEIHGHCVIVQKSASDTAGIPCSNTALSLIDTSTSEATHTRASQNGGFKFAADSDSIYVIRADSGSYIVLSPNGKIKPGTLDVELKLQEN